MSLEYFRAVARHRTDSDLDESHNCATERCAYSYATSWVIEAIKNDLLLVDSVHVKALRTLYEKEDYKEFLSVWNQWYGRVYKVEVYCADLDADEEFVPWPTK